MEPQYHLAQRVDIQNVPSSQSAPWWSLNSTADKLVDDEGVVAIGSVAEPQ